jgi:hypothetical protein
MRQLLFFTIFWRNTLRVAYLTDTTNVIESGDMSNRSISIITFLSFHNMVLIEEELYIYIQYDVIV